VNSGLRCFVALELPAGLRESVAAFFSREGRGIAGVRWLDGARLHLTLKFLGDVASERLPAVRAAVASAVSGRGPFTLELCGAGAFPSAERPRVVWVGAGAGAAEAAGLSASLEASLEPLGFARELRPFAPHLTVGRVKGPLRDRAALPRLLASVRDRVWGEAVIPAVHLLRSELFPAGPNYSILATNQLPGLARRCS
jgi:RNA 2',3'-cyclic 3'-phosphodiesterase